MLENKCFAGDKIQFRIAAFDTHSPGQQHCIKEYKVNITVQSTPGPRASVCGVGEATPLGCLCLLRCVVDKETLLTDLPALGSK